MHLHIMLYKYWTLLTVQHARRNSIKQPQLNLDKIKYVRHFQSRRHSLLAIEELQHRVLVRCEHAHHHCHWHILQNHIITKAHQSK